VRRAPRAAALAFAGVAVSGLSQWQCALSTGEMGARVVSVGRYAEI